MPTREPTKPRTEYNAQLDRIEKTIIGNGQEGLIARTARIEEKLTIVSEAALHAANKAETAFERADNAVAEAAKAVNSLAMSILTLENTLKTHVGTDHLSVLMRKKQFWALIILGFIILHLISTYVPSVWDGIMVLVGIPKLVIPIK